MARKVTPYTVIRWAIEFCAYTDEGLSEHQAKKIIGLDTMRALGLSNIQ